MKRARRGLKDDFVLGTSGKVDILVVRKWYAMIREMTRLVDSLGASKKPDSHKAPSPASGGDVVAGAGADALRNVLEVIDGQEGKDGTRSL